ncbi:MAG: fluoride efflux transporter CrcB [Planctomycetia bacterium]|nr:fluoride efflux transporter CrcB [Planctomycetia bacterium]
MLSAVWFRVLLVALAGACGALARWGTGYLVQSSLGRTWPLGTLVVNALGCIVFGAAMGYIKPEQMQQPGDEVMRLVLLTGFCGAYTTYSTFAFDVYELWISRGPWWAVGNIAAQLIAGLTAIVLGVAMGRAVG